MKPNFFDQGSPYLHHPLLTPQRTKAEIDFVLSLMDLNPGDSLLDIGCGAGRHSIELARRGFNVLGIDPSAVMIAAARERAAAERNKPQFLQAKGEDFQWTSQFDASICLFTTLGQVNNGDDNRQLLQNASRSLHPQAWFILEVPQRGWTVNHLKTSERIGEGESVTEIERSYDEQLKQVTEQFTLGQRKFLLRYRLFNQAEIDELLGEAGFTAITFYDGYENAPLVPDSPNMVVSARAAAP